MESPDITNDGTSPEGAHGPMAFAYDLQASFNAQSDILKNYIKGKLTFGEELANVITHGVAALIVLVAFPMASIMTYLRGTIGDVIGVTIFCISIFLMFLMSTLYHSMEHNSSHKRVMHILDHIFIYVAIAGTYT